MKLILPIWSRIHHIVAVAIPGTIMLFHVTHLRIFFKMETVDTVMCGILIATVMDTTARYDRHIGILPHVKVIINKIL